MSKVCKRCGVNVAKKELKMNYDRVIMLNISRGSQEVTQTLRK